MLLGEVNKGVEMVERGLKGKVNRREKFIGEILLILAKFIRKQYSEAYAELEAIEEYLQDDIEIEWNFSEIERIISEHIVEEHRNKLIGIVMKFHKNHVKS